MRKNPGWFGIGALAGVFAFLPPLFLQGQGTANGVIPTPKLSTACQALDMLHLDGVTSIKADPITSGQVQPVAGAAITGLPAFCRVLIIASPAAGSSINVEVWIPAEGWNGRFLGSGNGGGGGKIYYPPMRAGLKRGFVTANTDLGTYPNADKAADSPEKWIDFGYRATHVMTVVSKAVINAYFGVPAKYTYFWGNSTGGQQAMSEAQRFPEDYNGILAGSAAFNRTHLHSMFVWNYQATHKVEGKSSFTTDNISDVTKAVVAACAGKDGGAPQDDFLTDPRMCKFDPASMPLCDDGHASKCLTAPQREALKRIYAGPANPKTGERIAVPMPFGSENSGLGISYQETQNSARQLLYPFLWGFGKDFDPMTFDFDRDESSFDEKLAGILNANNPDLTAFQKKGGKLILFAGAADGGVPFTDEVGYYERVVGFERDHPQPGAAKDPLVATQSFFRFYVVPGMAHGGGGPGLATFGQLVQATDDDVLHALELWFEHGVAPNQFLATGWNEGKPSEGVRLRRNICPYPAFPTYIGGDPGKETSFQCRAHARGLEGGPSKRYTR